MEPGYEAGGRGFGEGVALGQEVALGIQPDLGFGEAAARFAGLPQGDVGKAAGPGGNFQPAGLGPGEGVAGHNQGLIQGKGRLAGRQRGRDWVRRSMDLQQAFHGFGDFQHQAGQE